MNKNNCRFGRPGLYYPSMDKMLDYAANKKNVIWDWNGTLVDDVDYVLGVINPILSSHGLETTNLARYRDIFGFPVRDYYLKLGFDLDKNCFKKLSDEFHQRYYANFHSCELFSSSKRCLEEFKTLGKTQSILSAADQPSLSKAIEKFNLSEFFKYVYGIEDNMASSKLKRGLELLENSGFGASETLLFGDTDHDLEVGLALGIDVVLVSHGHQSKERLLQIHDKVI